MSDAASRPSTLGELRTSGWQDHPVKDELRHNVISRLRNGQPLFPGIVGFDGTVLPALERAILAGHDIVLLGERGQAKTRLIRGLVQLLDPEIPVVVGGEVNDSPYHPVSAAAAGVIAEMGEETPIAWLPRERRYGEKLATPDTSVADLIGDVDPIRVAEGRYLSDELVIHYGLVPRTNRGIFSINELPDLPARIQVSLFNVLEERDVQIRGFQVRMPIDLLLVATANPEDYTNRGRIITPLKDRFGSEIRTHYPLDPADEIEIMEREMRPPSSDVPVVVPEFMKEVLAAFTRAARRSPHINQRAGVSVRLSIANLETLAASAVRRAIRLGEDEAVGRISDLPATLQSTAGRIEFETFEEGREDGILGQLLGHAVLEVFVARLQGHDLRWIVDRFEQDGLVVASGDLVPATDLAGPFAEAPGLTAMLHRLGVDRPSLGLTASAIELALEGLHLSRRLNKTAAGRYSAV